MSITITEKWFIYFYLTLYGIVAALLPIWLIKVLIMGIF